MQIDTQDLATINEATYDEELDVLRVVVMGRSRDFTILYGSPGETRVESDLERLDQRLTAAGILR